ncbi:hypothetical protein [Pseudidiomarina salilacus]|uniref:hypothetical protein n=1 Tax=Pseudidiomarina salilacus TaxID=3384452 RepID=UPI0039852D91
MKYVIGLLIISLLLAPLQVSAHAPAPAVGAEHAAMQMMDHASNDDMATDHACCDDAAAATEMVAAAMDCDGSCDTCQNFCGASALGLLPSLALVSHFSSVQPWRLSAEPAIHRKDRLERPPMPA